MKSQQHYNNFSHFLALKFWSNTKVGESWFYSAWHSRVNVY